MVDFEGDTVKKNRGTCAEGEVGVYLGVQREKRDGETSGWSFGSTLEERGEWEDPRMEIRDPQARLCGVSGEIWRSQGGFWRAPGWIFGIPELI